MKRYTYDIICKVDMSVFSGVNKLITELNSHMYAFGFNENMGITSETSIGSISITWPDDTSVDYRLLMNTIQEGLDKSELLKKFTVVGLKQVGVEDVANIRMTSDDRNLEPELQIMIIEAFIPEYYLENDNLMDHPFFIYFDKKIGVKLLIDLRLYSISRVQYCTTYQCRKGTVSLRASAKQEQPQRRIDTEL